MTNRVLILSAAVVLLAVAMPGYAQGTGASTPPHSTHPPYLDANGHLDVDKALQELGAENDALRAQLEAEHDQHAADSRAINELRQEVAELRQEIHAR